MLTNYSEDYIYEGYIEKISDMLVTRSLHDMHLSSPGFYTDMRPNDIVVLGSWEADASR